MYHIKVKKGMLFDGFDGKVYSVNKSTTIALETDSVDEFMSKLKVSGLEESTVNKFALSNAADMMFLFRLAVVIGDEGVIFTNGTLTWLDDVHNLNVASVQPIDTKASSYLKVLIRLLDWLMDAEVNKARELLEVDVLNTAILDAGYELYKELAVRLIDNSTVSPKFDELIKLLANRRWTFEIMNCKELDEDKLSPFKEYVCERHVGKDVRMIYVIVGNHEYVVHEYDNKLLTELIQEVSSR